MAKRLLPDSEKALYKATEVVDANTWPSALPSEFGDIDVRVLCCKFGLPYSDVKTEYHDYKKRGGDTKSILMKYLVYRINTVPVSTAECERGFSKMDTVCTPLHTRYRSHIITYVYFNLYAFSKAVEASALRDVIVDWK